jgi:hypothetical protein
MSHNAFVSLGARPILLQLENILQRRDGHSAGLDKPIHCTLMCFGRDVAAGICRDIDLEAFLQEFEPGKWGGKLASGMKQNLPALRLTASK